MEQQEIRNQARNKTIDILLGDNNPNNNFYAKTFETYNYNDTEMIPISPLYMENVNQEHNIVITEEAYKDLLKIRQITQQTNDEVAFFLFGEEKQNGTVWFDTVISSFKPSTRTAANFTDINPQLNQYVNMIQSGQLGNTNKQVICHGHTHGRTHVSDNFSFGDLITYVQTTNLHPSFKNREIETIGLLMPPNGDFNFIMYDNNPNCEGFYTFPTAYVRHNDSSADVLPCYSNGNYLINESITRGTM